MRDVLRLRGHLAVDLVDHATGRRWRVEQKNLVVTAGKNLVRDFLAGDSVAGITHLAVGTGNTAAAAADTELDTEVEREPITAVSKNSGQLVVTYFLATGVANGNTLREAGLFNDGSAGTMFSRAVLASDIVKTSSVSATFTWTITVG